MTFTAQELEIIRGEVEMKSIKLSFELQHEMSVAGVRRPEQMYTDYPDFEKKFIKFKEVCALTSKIRKMQQK